MQAPVVAASDTSESVLSVSEFPVSELVEPDELPESSSLVVASSALLEALVAASDALLADVALDELSSLDALLALDELSALDDEAELAELDDVDDVELLLDESDDDFLVGNVRLTFVFSESISIV